MAPDFIERLKASAWHQLYLPLLPFTHARSESSTLPVLNSNFLQLGRRSGGRPQRTVYPRRLPVNTVIHTTLAGLEPTTNLQTHTLAVMLTAYHGPFLTSVHKLPYSRRIDTRTLIIVTIVISINAAETRVSNK